MPKTAQRNEQSCWKCLGRNKTKEIVNSRDIFILIFIFGLEGKFGSVPVFPTNNAICQQIKAQTEIDLRDDGSRVGIL